MKRTMLLLMALLAFAHAALAEDFSAYEVKTNGFAVFAPNPILENGDMYLKLVDCLEKCLIYGHIRRFAN